MEPSPGFKSRLMRRAELELAEARRRATDRRRAWAGGFVLLVAVVGGLWYEQQPVARYELTGDLPGSAVVEVKRSDGAEVDLRGLPEPDPGSLYEVWLVRGSDPELLGTSALGTATIPLRSNLDTGVVAITLESGFVSQPSTPVRMQASID